MVRTAKPKSENERLSEFVSRVAEKHGFEVYKSGWARTTYDINRRDTRTREITLMARVESFVTTNGEIRLYDRAADKFAEELGVELEKAFPQIGEAVIVEDFAE